MPDPQRLKDLFERASELPEMEREPFVRLEAGDDTALAQQVLGLLGCASEADRVLGPVTDSEGATSASGVEARARSERVGRYKILGVLGEGGFGVVYEAEQTEPVKRRVALKVIKPGMDSKAVIARFEAERQALALMDHPCVARVLDAGTTERGLPYFVMERVRGEPITAHCDRQKLPIRDRLELFISVCEAVQHAHSKGIIHRDLKPSNILVESEAGTSTPKVIDFGVAKALGQRLTEATVFTQQGQMVGTPEYMSPEQAEMTAADIDTRSDIYSLGVLLYELLTGLRPFDLRKAGLAEMQRVIRETEPPRPSTRLSGSGERTTTLARSRGADPRTLTRHLRGDLDWIVLRALAKDRDRRYETANAFGADVRRFLKHEPVAAGPPSTRYRLAKFVRRNRTGVTAAAVIVLVLLGATVVSTLQWRATETALATADFRLREFRKDRLEWFQNQKELIRSTRMVVELRAGIPQDAASEFPEDSQPRADEWLDQLMPDSYRSFRGGSIDLFMDVQDGLWAIRVSYGGDDRIDPARRWMIDHAELSRRIVDEGTRRLLDFAYWDRESDEAAIWMGWAPTGALGRLTRLLLAHAAMEHEHDRHDDAARTLLALRRAVRSIGDLPVMMCLTQENSLRQAMYSDVALLAIDAAASGDDPSPYTEFMESDAPIRSTDLHLQGERGLMRQITTELFIPGSIGADPRLERSRLVEYSDEGFAFSDREIQMLAGIAATTPISFAKTSEEVDAYIEEFRRTEGMSFFELTRKIDEFRQADSATRTLLYHWLLNGYRAELTHRRAELARDGAICATAIAEHRYAQGVWPETLAEALEGRAQQPLRPEYWDRPFMYEIMDGEPVLYAGTLPRTDGHVQDDFSGDEWAIILAPKSWRDAMIDRRLGPRDEDE